MSDVAAEAAEAEERSSVQNSIDTLLLGPPLSLSCSSLNNINIDINETIQNNTNKIHHDGVVRPMICRMLIASKTLRMDTETRFTAIVLWHRYCHAILIATGAICSGDRATADTRDSTATRIRHCNADAAWAAAACLFLACKVEEEPVRLRDIINVAQMVLKVGDTGSGGSGIGTVAATTSATSTEQPTPTISQQQSTDTTITNGTTAIERHITMTIRVNSNPPRLDEEYWQTKETIVRAEQVVLRWVGFDTSVSKPHRAVVILLENYLLHKKTKDATISNGSSRGSVFHQQHDGNYDTNTNCELLTAEQMVPIAWKRLNDALFDSAALYYTVLELACAAIGLAVDELLLLAAPTATNKGESADDDDHWWMQFDISQASYLAAKQALVRATEGLVGIELYKLN